MALAYSFPHSNFVERLGVSRSHCLHPFGCASDCVQEILARDRIDVIVPDWLPRDPLLRSHGPRERNNKLARGTKLFSIRLSLKFNLDPITSDDHLPNMLRNEIPV
jgi:hypothetical protein